MNKHVTILVLESNEENRSIVSESFKLPGTIDETVIFGNVEPAIAYLKKEGIYVNTKTPDLILLDLDSQEKPGIELLSYIKNERKLKVIPVIIIGTSFTGEVLNMCYQNRANCIIAKPVNFKKNSQVIETIKDFWINIAELPKINDES